jgi:HK97 family phage major capsid protein
MMNSKTLREERGEIVKQLQDLVVNAKKENRSLSNEEMEKFDRLDSAQEDLKNKIDGLERIEKFDNLTLEESRNAIRTVRPESRSNAVSKELAYRGWFTHGTKGCKKEYRDAAAQYDIDLSSPVLNIPLARRQYRSDAELRAQTIGTSTAGGDLVAVDNQLMYQVERALKYYGGMMDVSRVLRTETGANLPVPTTNDTANAGVIIGEGSSITEVDETFGQVVLNAYKLTSGLVQASWELMTDSAVSIAEFVGESLGIRIARGINSYATNGTGSGGSPAQPRGFLLDAHSGLTSETTGGTVITYNDLVGLEASLDPAYRKNATAMFNSGTLATLKQIVDGNGRPLWQAGLTGFAEGNQDRFMGYPYILNQDMPAVAAGNTPIALGDFSKYYLRIVAGGNDGGIELVRLNERYADQGLVAFIAWVRLDGRLIDAGTHPIQLLTMHA